MPSRHKNKNLIPKNKTIFKTLISKLKKFITNTLTLNLKEIIVKLTISRLVKRT